MIRLLVPAVVVVLSLAGLAAQAPTFEVASIKRNNSGTGMMSVGMQPGGRLHMVNVPVRNLIIRAYGVQPYQIIGGPDWITSDRFDVLTKAEGDATPEQVNLMLRSLLAERFKLAVHTETRELPVYYLVNARDDGRLGPDLKPAAVPCGPPGRGRAGGPLPGRGAGGGCGMMMTFGRVQASGQPIAAIATSLANQLGRPIIDKTGLTGSYDFTLSWTPEGGRGGGPLPPGVPEPPPIDPNGPSLFTAIQEQLGLKLESDRGPVEVIVIDGVEPPTED